MTKHILQLALSLLLATPLWAQWASIGSIGTNSEKVADTQLTVTATNTLNSGNAGVCVFATDNIGTLYQDNDDHTTVTDDDGNTWTQRAEVTNAGNANAAVTVSVWTTVAGADLADPDLIYLNTASAVTAKAALCWEFTIGAGNVISVVGTTTTEQVDLGDAGSLASATVASAEYLFVRGIGYESDADVTGLTATASPAFTSCGVVSTDGGGEFGNMGASCEFIIAAATSETSDPTFTGDATHDNASVFPVLKEAAAEARNRAVVIQ